MLRKERIAKARQRQRQRRIQDSEYDDYNWEADPWGYSFYGEKVPKEKADGFDPSVTAAALVALQSAAMSMVQQYGTDELAALGEAYTDKEEAEAAKPQPKPKPVPRDRKERGGKKKKREPKKKEGAVENEAAAHEEQAPAGEKLLSIVTEAFPEIKAKEKEDVGNESDSDEDYDPLAVPNRQVSAPAPAPACTLHYPVTMGHTHARAHTQGHYSITRGALPRHIGATACTYTDVRAHTHTQL